MRFYPDGAVWANLGGIEMKPFVADAALLKALPGKLGSAVEELQLKGGAELLVKHLVVLTPPDDRNPAARTRSIGARRPRDARAQSPDSAALPRPDPVVYWDAEVKLVGASLDTGVAWEDVFGAVACRGRYEGTHIGRGSRKRVARPRGHLAQPVTAARCQLKADPQQPDPARPGQYLPTTVEFTDVAGDLFHGTLGGEAASSSPSRRDSSCG